MALRKMESWDWAQSSIDSWFARRWNIQGGGIMSTTTGRRVGSIAAQGRTIGQIFDAQQTWTIHCAIKFYDGEWSFQFRDGATVQCAIYFNNIAQKLDAYRGLGTTLLGQTTTSVSSDTYHYVAVKCTISPSAGVVVIYVDGAEALNLTGQNTRATANSYADQLLIAPAHGCHDIYITDGTGSAPYNGIVGDIAVKGLQPNGAGNSSDWIRASGSNNYEMVDETTPDSDTTYNAAASAGSKDSYAVPNVTLTGTCRGIGVSALVRKDDAGTRQARLYLYDGSTQHNGTTRNLADSYEIKEEVWQVHPITGVPFTNAQVNACEPGIELIT